MPTLAEANRLAAGAFAGAAVALARAEQSLARVTPRLVPGVQVEISVGAGAGREAELITQQLTRLAPSVGNDLTSTRGRLALEHVTQRHAGAGASTADARVAEIYTALATFVQYAPPTAQGFRG